MTLPPIPTDMTPAQRSFFIALRQALLDAQKRLAVLENTTQAQQSKARVK